MLTGIQKLLRRLTSVGLLVAGFLSPWYVQASTTTLNATLAWDPSSSANVMGYNLYSGIASGTYTNMTVVGNTNAVTISGLVAGTTYYFAVQAVDITGLESGLSSEISYTPASPTVAARLQMVCQPGKPVLLSGSGPAGYRYNLLASSRLNTWTNLGTVTMDGTGACQFSDSAPTNGMRLYRLQQVYP